MISKKILFYSLFSSLAFITCQSWAMNSDISVYTQNGETIYLLYGQRITKEQATQCGVQVNLTNSTHKTHQSTQDFQGRKVTTLLVNGRETTESRGPDESTFTHVGNAAQPQTNPNSSKLDDGWSSGSSSESSSSSKGSSSKSWPTGGPYTTNLHQERSLCSDSEASYEPYLTPKLTLDKSNRGHSLRYKFIIMFSILGGITIVEELLRHYQNKKIRKREKKLRKMVH